MRFKTKLEGATLATFISIGHCLEKVSEECVLYLTKDSFEFRKRDPGENGIQVFASVSVNEVNFCEYLIQSKANDVICARVSLKNLMRAFKSSDRAEFTQMKLTKKGQVPCFSFLSETEFTIAQDVPILKLLSKESMEDYREPSLSPPEISIQFPDPRHVKTVIERMKVMDKFVYVTLNIKGTLIFKVQTEVVCMRTYYQGLDVVEADEMSKSNLGGKVTVRVNISDFLSLLHFGSAHFEKCLVCAVPNEALVLFVQFEDNIGAMTYYCPLAGSDEDDY
mmetsp:Transcript_10983/g.17995  ORF Transcript_10983/g.17995 Transcript_10983/m.17995 type:complete len:279 (-) Transcript_10983:4-840(-)